ncbi:hypothetical protein [Epibacterium ulvae]|uniref:hypothetical protein n=1 Tax=Epibacterium ulvae TaxID=1156985 RepID=UPI0024937F90|nr:hypothetical protein [Epibacterium ulvae]
MTDQVCFEMPSDQRERLIRRHEFYVDQAKKRLILQFVEDEIRTEANNIGQSYLDSNQSRYNPEAIGGDGIVEEAQDEMNERYWMLADMRDSVRLSIISSIFHEWEKCLRQWLVDEVSRWHHGDNTRDQIWRVNLEAQKGDNSILALLESFGWALRDFDFFKNLDACRLVVNVYKHGDGPSLTDLSKKYPEKYLEHPLGGPCEWLGEQWSYKHLNISDEDLDLFADAIKKFWKTLPEKVLDRQIEEPPSWLTKAIKQDREKKDIS